MPPPVSVAIEQRLHCGNQLHTQDGGNYVNYEYIHNLLYTISGAGPFPLPSMPMVVTMVGHLIFTILVWFILQLTAKIHHLEQELFIYCLSYPAEPTPRNLPLNLCLWQVVCCFGPHCQELCLQCMSMPAFHFCHLDQMAKYSPSANHWQPPLLTCQYYMGHCPPICIHTLWMDVTAATILGQGKSSFNGRWPCIDHFIATWNWSSPSQGVVTLHLMNWSCHGWLTLTCLTLFCEVWVTH